MLRKMLPEFSLQFDDERADDAVLELLGEEHLIPLQEDGDDPLSVLDRLGRKHGG